MSGSIQAVTSPELKKWLDAGDVILIDVRETIEYKQSHIKSAVHIPLSDISLSHPDMPNHEGKRLVLQCKSGRRSMIACEKLSAEGKDDNLYNLTGGLDGWMQNNFPVESDDKKTMPLERQVLLAAGLVVLVGVTLGFVISSSWFLLSGFAGLGMTLAGLTGWCGMAKLLAMMPWNK